MTQEWIGKVASNKNRGGGYYSLSLEFPRSFPTPKPGMFAMLSAGNEPAILLRRPMAFYDFEKKPKNALVSILYNVVGRGTEAISQFEKNSTVSLLGPIGNSFSTPKPGEKVVVVAGGIGIAPFLLWGKSLTTNQKKQVSIYFGFRNKNQLAILSDFKKEKLKPNVAIEGPGGDFKGNVVDFLKKEFEKETPTKILTCGPEKMMNAVLALAKEKRVFCEASLEARMACGVGVCLSCVCEAGEGKRVGGYSLVCQDGPVFILNNLPG